MRLSNGLAAGTQLAFRLREDLSLNPGEQDEDFADSLLAATFLVGSLGVAAAQTATTPAATDDPAKLPVFHGKVAAIQPHAPRRCRRADPGRWDRGHLPPHLGIQLVFAVKPGDMVTIKGLHAHAVAMVQAMSVSNDATGNSVTDSGPGAAPGPRGREQALTAQGRIKEQLHGPKGELNGALLEDGTIVRLPPHEAARLAADLAPGAALYVQGQGFEGPLGRVIAARAIGPDLEQLVQIALPAHGHREPPLGQAETAPPAGPDAPAAGPDAPPPPAE